MGEIGFLLASTAVCACAYWGVRKAVAWHLERIEPIPQPECLGVWRQSWSKVAPGKPDHGRTLWNAEYVALLHANGRRELVVVTNVDQQSLEACARYTRLKAWELGASLPKPQNANTQEDDDGGSD